MLRDYQKDIFKRMVTEKRHLNYLDMGLGKSLTTSLSIMYTQAFPCMIVCTKAAMYVWEEELAKWFDEPAIIYVGKPKQREQQWKHFVDGGYRFIITNYALAAELGQRFGIVDGKKVKGSSKSGTTNVKPPTPGTHKWHVGGLIADEIQLGGLFNHKTKAYSVFKQLAKSIEHVYLLTGTPSRKGAIDYFGPLSLMDPDRFDSYWKYVNKHCVTIDTGFGKSIERNPKDIIAFRAMLREYATILKKADVAKDLKGKIRQTIPVLMDDEQAKIYKELTEELMAITEGGELIITPSVLSLLVRQRQLLACPQELGLETRGAAIDAMLEMSEGLVNANEPFVIFTPFKKAVKWIASALQEEYPGITVFEITGGLTAEEFGNQWKGFQNFSRRAPSVLICVIRSGSSFHATRASTAFFIGYEWDFNQNEQAEDRLNRIGQKDLVTCYYMMHKGTVDEEVAQRLNDKKYSADLVLSNEEMFQSMLKGRKQ